MADKEWISFIIKKSAIPEKRLTLLPVLRTCDNWKKVLPLGLVDHVTSLAVYRGALVELNGKLYFVRKETLAALQGEINWQFPRLVEVLKEK